MNIVLRVIIDIFILGGCFFALAGVVMLVELCIREKVSGIRTMPTAPARAKKQPPRMNMSMMTLSTMFIAFPPDTYR